MVLYIIGTVLMAHMLFKVQGQPTLTLYTDPPTNGSVHFFCGSNGAQSNLTITCNFSSSLITPDVVINGERYSVSELSEPYTLVNTTESTVVIRVLLSSAQNRFNFSCVMSETLATRTITFEEDFNQCMLPANTSTDSPHSATGSTVSTGTSTTQVTPTSQLPLPSQTPGSNGNETATSNNDPQLAAIAVVPVMIIVIIFGAILIFCWYKKKKGHQRNDGNGVNGVDQDDGGLPLVVNNVLAEQLQEQSTSGANIVVANGEQHEVVARQPDHPSKEEGDSREQPTCTNTAAEHEVEGVRMPSRPRTEGGRGSDEKLNLAVQESTNVGVTRSDLVVRRSATPLSKTPSPLADHHLPEDPSE